MATNRELLDGAFAAYDEGDIFGLAINGLSLYTNKRNADKDAKAARKAANKLAAKAGRVGNNPLAIAQGGDPSFTASGTSSSSLFYDASKSRGTGMSVGIPMLIVVAGVYFLMRGR